MKIAVIGAGAIGSIIAGYLSKAGEDVVLTGRQDQVDIINKKGLCINSSDGEDIIQIKTLNKLDQEYDIVIFAVKTQDIEQAFQDNHEYLENSLILTTQNGVQSDNILSCHFEREKMISSIVMFGGTYIEPGNVTLNFPGDWIIGKPYALNDNVVFEVSEILKKVANVVITSNIMGMKWLKLFINFNNCIPAVLGRSMQETFSDMDFCRLSVLLLKEGLEVINQTQIKMESMPNFPVERIYGMASMPVDQAAGIINKTLTNLSKEPLYGSILQSILRRKTSEIDFINGEVVCIAQSMKGSCPLNKKIVDLVHEVERDWNFFKPEFIKKEFNL